MDVDNSLFQTTAVCLQNPHLITGLCVPLSVPDWLLTPALLPVCSCCRRFDPVLCKALLSPKPHSECSPISPESSLLLSFASVGTDLFLSYTTVSDFLTQWERWIAIFSGYCLHSAISCRTVSTGPGPSHHSQVSPLCIETSWSDCHASIYLCGVTASSKWKSLSTQKPNSQEHPRYFSEFRESVAFTYACQRYFYFTYSSLLGVS